MVQNAERKQDQRMLGAEKLESIRRAVIELFSEQAFRDVGMRDLCRKAKITPNTVYKYFGNKDTLVIRAITPDLEVLFDTLESIESGDGSLAERFRRLNYEYFHFYFSNLPLARIVFLYIPSAYFTSNPEFVQTRSLSAMARLVAEGQKSGQVRSDFPPEDLVEAMAAVAMRRMFKLLSNTKLPRDAKKESERLDVLLAPLLGVEGA